MPMIYKLNGELPSDLPPGRYAVRIVKSYFEGNDWIIETEFAPGLKSGDTLLSLVKE
jgi:hypothetical protein